MDTLLVVAHPRRESLTQAVAAAFAAAIERRGHRIEWADLVAERFDPVLQSADEPDWANSKKIYSETVRREIGRIERNAATVIVFPVWWWSMPAILKGWIDRVWNFGFAYGPCSYPHRRVWLIGVAGVGRANYETGAFDVAIRTQLGAGLLEYCGVSESRVELLFGAIESPEQAAAAIAKTRLLGEEF